MIVLYTLLELMDLLFSGDIKLNPRLNNGNAGSGLNLMLDTMLESTKKLLNHF
jgi:hypothetical protein